MSVVLIDQLVKETIDFANYLDYEVDIDEELMLLSIKNNQELLDELNNLPQYEYKEIVDIVLEKSYDSFYA